jgi:hydrogenase large subunit
VHMSLGTGKTLTKLHTPHAFNAEY